MKCPIDGTDLVMAERQGIEIDYCPKCRGVWRDRGELDKIIERSAAEEAPQRRQQEEHRREPRYRSDDDHHSHRRKKSLLGDIFDF